MAGPPLFPALIGELIRTTKFSCWLFFKLGFGLEVTGQAGVPKRGPFIVASNHVSFLDPPLIGVACPRRLRFMARADLYHQPLLAAFLRGVRTISIKRGEADLTAIRAGLACLRAGEPVAIFPEGGRQLSGALGSAKRGVGFLAEAAGVPVIPAYVSGTFQALPPHAHGLCRAKIRVAFGEPIAYTSVPVSTTAGPDAGVRGSRARQESLADAVTRQWKHLAAYRPE